MYNARLGLDAWWILHMCALFYLFLNFLFMYPLEILYINLIIPFTMKTNLSQSQKSMGPFLGYLLSLEGKLFLGLL